MKLFVKNLKDLVLPKKANVSDAMYDVVATTDPVIVGSSIERPLDGMKLWERIVYIEYGTNLFVSPESVEYSNYNAAGEQLPSNWQYYHLKFYPRSSISKQNMHLANSVGTIDNGYRNQIFLRFKYEWQPKDYVVLPEAGIMKIYGILDLDTIYQKGDKIIQFEPVLNQNVDFELVEKLPDSERGLGGFGSSGK